jgi:hypothetical protein
MSMRRGTLSMIAAALTLTLGACSPTADSSRSAVLEGDQAAALHVQCARPSIEVEGAWAPSPADIQAAESALEPVLAARLNQIPAFGLKLAPQAYYRQYAGLVVGGKRLVYVNGFYENYVRMAANRQPDFWRKERIDVCGGGALYFGATFDPNTKAVALEFNTD